jgi:response regulator of citrate/malate metabolism
MHTFALPKPEYRLRIMYQLECILLVDDDASANFLNSQIIQESTHVKELIATESVEEALHLLRHRRESGKALPDLVFLDVMMPKLSGWDFLSAYKAEFGEARRGSVVMLTASTDVREMLRCSVHPEVADFINKPLSGEETQRILEQYAWQQRLSSAQHTAQG